MPFQSSRPAFLLCDIISHHNVSPDYDNDDYNVALQHYYLFLGIS